MLITAAVMRQQGLPTPFAKSNPYSIEQVVLEGPVGNEVLVEIRGAGLCHSDLSAVKGAFNRPVPIVGGHEGAGVVVEVGADVTAFAVGDHVALAAVASCGICRTCTLGKPALCQMLSVARANGTLTNGNRKLKFQDGKPLNHYGAISVFAEYAVVTTDSLVKVDKAVPMDVAALFGCAVITGAGAVYNSTKIREGATVAVVGLGGVGLTAVMAAKEAGAGIIIGIDVLSSKFELARTVGATHCVNSTDVDALEKIQDLTNGGVEYVFEVSGHISALDLAYKIAARGGEVIVVGVGQAQTIFNIPQQSIVTDEKIIRGSFMGGGVAQNDIPRYAQMFMDGKLPIDKLFSSHVGFGQLNEAFDLLNSGTVVRQILQPQQK